MGSMLSQNQSGASSKKPGLLAYVPGVVMLLVITVLLLMPSSDLPQNPFFELIYFDKWVHVGLFAMLMFLWGIPGTRYVMNLKKHLLLIALLCVLYGIVMEYAQQTLTEDRSFDPIDMIADTAGVALGYVGLKMYKKKLLRKETVI